MTDIPPLSALGPRIMVLGPTNAGKSTLTQAISLRSGIPAIHLDQFRHLPHTNWQERNDAEFKALHDEAAATPAWIMGGSYSKLMAPRLTRVTGMIVVDESLWVRTGRYLWRSTFQRRRLGGLEGGQDSLQLRMLHWLWKTRDNSERTRDLAQQSGVPYVFCYDQRELDNLYRAWGLHRTAR